MYDALTIFPFVWIIPKTNTEIVRYLYLIKCLRLSLSYVRILDIKKLNHSIREGWFKKRNIAAS